MTSAAAVAGEIDPRATRTAGAALGPATMATAPAAPGNWSRALPQSSSGGGGGAAAWAAPPAGLALKHRIMPPWELL